MVGEAMDIVTALTIPPNLGAMEYGFARGRGVSDVPGAS
jgi:hypothetical protein